MEGAREQGESGFPRVLQGPGPVQESVHGLPASEGGFRHQSSVRLVWVQAAAAERMQQPAAELSGCWWQGDRKWLPPAGWEESGHSHPGMTHTQYLLIIFSKSYSFILS